MNIRIFIIVLLAVGFTGCDDLTNDPANNLGGENIQPPVNLGDDEASDYLSQAASLTIGRSREFAFNRRGDIDCFFFNAFYEQNIEDCIYIIKLSYEEANLRPTIFFYNEDGARIGSPSERDDQTITYYVTIHNDQAIYMEVFDSIGNMGRYELLIGEASPVSFGLNLINADEYNGLKAYFFTGTLDNYDYYSGAFSADINNGIGSGIFTFDGESNLEWRDLGIVKITGFIDIDDDGLFSGYDQYFSDYYYLYSEDTVMFEVDRDSFIASDSFEQNDYIENAKKISIGSMYELNFHHQYDHDFFVITVEADKTYSIRTIDDDITDDETMKIRLNVYDSERLLYWIDNNDYANFEWTSTENETLYIEIFTDYPNGTNKYSLIFEELP